MVILQHPRDYQTAIDNILVDCYNDVVNILIENGGVWVKEDDDTDYIVMKQWLGSPIICSLKVDGKDIYYKDALYGRNDVLPWKQYGWKRLRVEDAIHLYGQLWDKLGYE